MLITAYCSSRRFAGVAGGAGVLVPFISPPFSLNFFVFVLNSSDVGTLYDLESPLQRRALLGVACDEPLGNDDLERDSNASLLRVISGVDATVSFDVHR